MTRPSPKRAEPDEVASTFRRATLLGPGDVLVPVLCDQCEGESPSSTEFCVQCGALLEWHGTEVTGTGSAPTPVLPGVTKKQSREQVHLLVIAVSEPRLAVNAGERATVAVTVRNQGTIVEEVILGLVGLPEGGRHQLSLKSSTSVMAAWVPCEDGYTESMVIVSEEASLALIVVVWNDAESLRVMSLV